MKIKIKIKRMKLKSIIFLKKLHNKIMEKKSRRIKIILIIIGN
jgi:hypothetical protein